MDYLLKPLKRKVLDKAIARVYQTLSFRNKKNKKPAYSIDINGLIRNKKLAIKESKSINYIDIDEIVHLKADGNYTNIFLQNGQNLISSKVLKHYDELLSDFGFLRVHRSNMINLNYVKEFRHKYGGSIVLKNDEVIGIAPDKKKMFFNRLGMV